ncbi:hypothetical protein JI664_01155 [Rhodobacter sp. NTK016B]|uniref:hypothetical protein n=1 Tax=Rhodobacter sp. NTK016B TaxID=2759676 RepID=UPI001A8E200F|nr:hypothetical protein [Rhodobacter sp. NTK016B]MBN8290561.1 hypothetical protein [Rhodobacter sp. NTK016B]
MRSDKTPLEAVAWNAALRLVEFDYRSLSDEAQVGYETAGTWVRRWMRLGKVECLGKGDGQTMRYRVVGAALEPKPPVNRIGPQTPELNMWRTIRAMRVAFTPTDIAAHATTDTVEVSQKQARNYCQMLTRAGYLRVVRKALPPRREAVYQLIRDTGPRPPRERRLRVVWDDNEGEIAHLPGGDA